MNTAGTSLKKGKIAKKEKTKEEEVIVDLITKT